MDLEDSCCNDQSMFSLIINMNVETDTSLDQSEVIIVRMRIFVLCELRYLPLRVVGHHRNSSYTPRIGGEKITY